MVGYWRFEGSFQDASGKGNHLDYYIEPPSFSSASPALGTQNILFDGVDDEIGINNIDQSGLDFGTNDFTVGFWLKTTDDQADILVKSTGSFPQTRVRLVAGGHVQLVLNDGVNVVPASSSGFNFSDGSWHYVTLVADRSGDVQFFANGQLLNKVDISSVGDTSSVGPFRLGAFTGFTTTDTLLLEGELDELAVWGSLLSPGDVAEIYNIQKQKYSGLYDSPVLYLGGSSVNPPDLSWITPLPFGKALVGYSALSGGVETESAQSYKDVTGDLSDRLFGYWSLDERSADSALGGTDFADLSGQNHHLEETAGVSYNKNGQFHRAVLVAGASANLSTSPINIGDLTAFSASVWVKNSTSTVQAGNDVLMSVGVNKFVLTYTASSQLAGLFANDVAWHWTAYSSPYSDLDQWHHVAAVYDDGFFKIYRNGVEVVNDTDETGAVAFGASAFIKLGSTNSGSEPFLGYIDEAAFWSRALSADEVSLLYRRGSNRIKVQVKSCVDENCACQSYNSSPQGSSSDCDGDGVLNDFDSEDTYKSKFIGPGGDGSTYYSELLNRGDSNLVFNCALNTSDSSSSVCLDDEINLLGSSNSGSPFFSYTDYPQFVKPVDNRYAQYRFLFEADDNQACAGAPCLPQLTSFHSNPSGSLKYANEHISVSPKRAIVFSKLFGVRVKSEACATFRLKRAGNEYYHDNSSWVAATSESHRNTGNELEAHASQFALQYGAGELEVIGYLKSDNTQTQNCSIESIDVFYE